MYLIFLETSYWTTLTAESMRLYLLLFTQLSLKVEPSESKKQLARKQNLTRNRLATQGHSSSFILQLIICQQGIAYRHYNNAGLKVSEEVSTEIAVNCHPRQPHCRLTPLPGPLSRISAYTLYF